MRKDDHLSDPEVRAQAEAARADSNRRRREAINTTGRARARREPGDARNPADSIASHCCECITGFGDDVGGHGSVHAAIEACTSPLCHLWPWRDGGFHADDVLNERERGEH